MNPLNQTFSNITEKLNPKYRLLFLTTLGSTIYILTSPIIFNIWPVIGDIGSITQIRLISMLAYLSIPLSTSAYTVYRSIRIKENLFYGIISGTLFFITLFTANFTAIKVGRIDPLVSSGMHVTLVIPGSFIGIMTYLIKNQING